MYKINFDSLVNDLTPVASAFDELLNEGISSILGAGLVTFSPRVNVSESDDVYTIEVAAPGLKKEDFVIQLEGDQMKISVNVKNSDTDEKSFLRREFRHSSFVKSFHLPKNVNRQKINATYTDGVLTVAIEKITKSNSDLSRVIEIK